jgi:hypothetical protein
MRPLPPETAFQRAVVTFIRAQFPKVVVIPSFSGERRTLWQQIIAKALGLIPGIPDLLIAKPKFKNGVCLYSGLFLELKAGKKSVVSKHQKAILEQLSKDGYSCHVVRDYDSAEKIIREYLG